MSRDAPMLQIPCLAHQLDCKHYMLEFRIQEDNLFSGGRVLTTRPTHTGGLIRTTGGHG